MTEENSKLEALCRRGPWQGSGPWTGTSYEPPWTLSIEEVRAYYTALCVVSEAPWQALNLPEQDNPWGSHPKTNRANTLLKQARLIRFDRERKRVIDIAAYEEPTR